jgi:tight adherence protein C
MDMLLDLLTDPQGSAPLLIAFAGGLISLGVVAFALVGQVRARLEIKRRAIEGPGEVPAVTGSAFGDQDTAKKVLDFVSRKFVEVDAERAKLVRRKLVQGGFFDPGTVMTYLALRYVCAAVFGASGLIGLPFFVEDLSFSAHAVMTAGALLMGYIAPQFVLDRRIGARSGEIRANFPDFMDLMVVCSEAGLSMEAALTRIAQEMAGTSPALAQNIHFATLEIRAGRTLSDAFQRLAERLGIDEARSLATLLQQSEELGSSLTASLKVYSDDMRNKRLMKAEEKAYSLPAKLTVPLMLFIFPVLLAVLMLPVVVRFMTGQ